MRHAIILAHPSPASFNAAAARAYAAEVERLGHAAEIRDLCARGFDPVMRAAELPWAEPFAPGDDIDAERAWLSAADVIVFVYPFWFNAPPAILKGYVDRVFGMGFGFQADAPGTRPGLAGKRLVSISTSGAPDRWVDHTGALRDLKLRFDGLLGEVCGLGVLEHLHLGGVTPGLREDAVTDMLDAVTAMARRLFGAEASPPPAQDRPLGNGTELAAPGD